MIKRYPYETGGEIFSDIQDDDRFELNRINEELYWFTDPLTQERIEITPDSAEVLYMYGDNIYFAKGIKELLTEYEYGKKLNNYFLFSFLNDVGLVGDFVEWLTDGKVRIIEMEDRILNAIVWSYNDERNVELTYDGRREQGYLVTYIEDYYLDEFLKWWEEINEKIFG